MQGGEIQEKGGETTDDELYDDGKCGAGEEIAGNAGDCRKQEIGQVILLLFPPGESQNFAGEIGIECHGQVAIEGAGPADGLHADGGSIEQHGDGNGFLDDFQPQEEV